MGNEKMKHLQMAISEGVIPNRKGWRFAPAFSVWGWKMGMISLIPTKLSGLLSFLIIIPPHIKAEIFIIFKPVLLI